MTIIIRIKIFIYISPSINAIKTRHVMNPNANEPNANEVIIPPIQMDLAMASMLSAQSLFQFEILL